MTLWNHSRSHPSAAWTGVLTQEAPPLPLLGGALVSCPLRGWNGSVSCHLCNAVQAWVAYFFSVCVWRDWAEHVQKKSLEGWGWGWRRQVASRLRQRGLRRTASAGWWRLAVPCRFLNLGIKQLMLVVSMPQCVFTSRAAGGIKITARLLMWCKIGCKVLAPDGLAWRLYEASKNIIHYTDMNPTHS